MLFTRALADARGPLRAFRWLCAGTVGVLGLDASSRHSSGSSVRGAYGECSLAHRVVRPFGLQMHAMQRRRADDEAASMLRENNMASFQESDL